MRRCQRPPSRSLECHRSRILLPVSIKRFQRSSRSWSDEESHFFFNFCVLFLFCLVFVFLPFIISYNWQKQTIRHYTKGGFPVSRKFYVGYARVFHWLYFIKYKRSSKRLAFKAKVESGSTFTFNSSRSYNLLNFIYALKASQINVRNRRTIMNLRDSKNPP